MQKRIFLSSFIFCNAYKIVHFINASLDRTLSFVTRTSFGFFPNA